MDKGKQEKLQRLVIEAETFKRQIEGFSSQLQIYESVYAEVVDTIDSLEKIHGKERGEEILVPVGSGSFIRAELRDNEKVILGIGANVSIEESVEEAKKTLGERKERLAGEMEKLHEMIKDVSAKHEELSREYEGLLRSLQQESQK